MIQAFHHPGFAADIGEHVMPMRKFQMVADAVRPLAGVKVIEPEPIDDADLLRVHTLKYVNAVRTGEPRALAESQKFPWSPTLWPSVRLTNGGCLAAARQALRSGLGAAIVSGFHHSSADHGEGFCTFNGLVVAADALIAEGLVERVAVLDMDLHYGNGTASLALARPYLFNASIYGNDYFQNRPYSDVENRRHGDGPNHVSYALPGGSGRAPMLAALMQACEAILAWGRPDLILYQAGADPYREDPYSPLDLGQEDLRERDRLVFEWARDNGLPLAWVLAGGYTADTSKVVAVHVGTFEAALDVHGTS